MLNDKLYRQFKSQPFDETYDESAHFSQFRQTLLIDEIIKCGKDILGNIGIEFDESQDRTTQEDEKQNYRQENSNQTKRKQNQKAKYIYEYDYGKDRSSSRKQFHDFGDYSAQEISFTLSNEDNNRRQALKDDDVQEISQNQRRVQWKQNLIEQNQIFNKQLNKESQQYKNKLNLKPDNSIEKVGKWKKPIKTFQNTYFSHNQIQQIFNLTENAEKQSPVYVSRKLNKKSLEKNHTKVNFSTESTQKSMAIFYQSNSKDQYQSANNKYFTSKQEYKTPQKMTKLTKKTLKIPLSEQITKNIYGRLKTEVQAHSFIEEYKSRQQKQRQESTERWKNFINRSEKWMEEKKCHLLEMQINQRYEMQNKPQSKQNNQSEREKQYNSYTEMKVRHQPLSYNGQAYAVRNQHRFYPQYTFKSQNQSPLKRKSSVENCINKLKTQTQLLKVKLLSPLKNEIEDNEEIEHYKYLNESQGRKSLKKFNSRDLYQEKQFSKSPAGFNYVKSVYGKCIGEKPFK